MTARELFYQPISAPKSAAASKPATAKPAAQAAKPVQTEVARRQGRPTETAPSGESAASQVPVIPASQTNLAPLGLRYSVLKYAGDDGDVEVDTDMVFRAGDRVRLAVQTNDAGYLYVVMRGSSGNWKILFPAVEINETDNRVERGKSYMIPRSTRFIFDEQAGDEQLFVVLSRQPEPDFDQLITHLATGGGSPRKEEPKQVMLAKNTVDDSLIQRVRERLVARDLVFEKVSDTNAGARKEKANYVVDPSGSPQSRLVVDLKLQHR
ncbi:MAG: DUF4384 domain-containing protein [Bryobacteraceae bacterium]|nr:DUF4384 domain-containing protein [Bryobacteraceae bacterium]